MTRAVPGRLWGDVASAVLCGCAGAVGVPGMGVRSKAGGRCPGRPLPPHWLPAQGIFWLAVLVPEPGALPVG